MVDVVPNCMFEFPIQINIFEPWNFHQTNRFYRLQIPSWQMTQSKVHISSSLFGPFPMKISLLCRNFSGRKYLHCVDKYLQSLFWFIGACSSEINRFDVEYREKLRKLLLQIFWGFTLQYGIVSNGKRILNEGRWWTVMLFDACKAKLWYEFYLVSGNLIYYLFYRISIQY